MPSMRAGRPSFDRPRRGRNTDPRRSARWRRIRQREGALTTPVTSIQVFTDAPIAEDELRRGVAITLGQPLQGAEVSQTLRRLQTAGWGSDIEVRVLEHAARPAFRSCCAPRRESSRSACGPMKLAPSELRRSLAVAPGDFWSTEKVERSVASLTELYRSRGYPQPSSSRRTARCRERAGDRGGLSPGGGPALAHHRDHLRSAARRRSGERCPEGAAPGGR